MRIGENGQSDDRSARRRPGDGRRGAGTLDSREEREQLINR
jgi:hypothetical protein